MNILLTNDDGVHSKGLHALKRKLKELGHTVYIAAPETGSSCTGHAISVPGPIKSANIEIDNDSCLAVKGYPADSVFVGILNKYKNIKFDLLISGINYGANLGFDVNFSGTFGAAMEGLSHNIPSIAVSLFTHNIDADFTTACEWTVKVIEILKTNGFTKNILYNLNIPFNKKIKGITTAPMSQVKYFTQLEKRVDPYGKDYYFITGNYNWKLIEGQDADMLYKDYVVLTPIKIDFTDYTELTRLSEIFKN